MKQVKSMVQEILENDFKARNSDAYLYMRIVEKCGYTRSCRFESIIYEIIKKELPSFESVRRSRQKTQELLPHLKGTNNARRQSAGEQVREQINEPEFLEQQELF